MVGKALTLDFSRECFRCPTQREFQMASYENCKMTCHPPEVSRSVLIKRFKQRNIQQNVSGFVSRYYLLLEFLCRLPTCYITHTPPCAKRRKLHVSLLHIASARWRKAPPSSKGTAVFQYLLRLAVRAIETAFARLEHNTS